MPSNSTMFEFEFEGRVLKAIRPKVRADHTANVHPHGILVAVDRDYMLLDTKHLLGPTKKLNAVRLDLFVNRES